jgi:hypothetical protein
VPVHDWTRASAGGFHKFPRDWTIEIYRALDRGVLPAGYAVYTDLQVSGWGPDVVAIHSGGRAAPVGAVAPGSGQGAAGAGARPSRRRFSSKRARANS